MRFGIMALQLGLILPAAAGDTPAAARARLAAFDVAALVSTLADAGFSTVELNTDLELFLPGCYDEAALDRLATLQERRGLAYTVHLPLWSIEPSTPDPRVRQASLAALADSLYRLSRLEPAVFVLHATGALAAEFGRLGLPPLAKALVTDVFRDRARASLAALLAQTGVAPRRLALENVEFPFEATLALAEEFDCSLCLDTGHLLAGLSGPWGFDEAVERALPRLAEVHLHDGYRRQGKGGAVAADHLPLGRGDLPLAWLLGRLEATRFAGPLVLELSLADALASLAAVRRARPGLLPD